MTPSNTYFMDALQLRIAVPLPSQFIFFLVPFQYRNSISASSIALPFTEEEREAGDEDKGNLRARHLEEIPKLLLRALFSVASLLTLFY